VSKKTAEKRKKGSKSIMAKRQRKKHGNVVTLRKKLRDIYDMVNLETTCCRQCVCCSVACPQMNFCEATQILDEVWSKWSQDDKKALVVKSMRYYFSNSMVKACPLLGEMEDELPGCRVYEDRPLNCRMYGQWPKEQYEKRVTTFQSITGFRREDLPLNTQCDHVRRVDDSIELTGEIIDGLTSSLDLLDVRINKYKPEQIDKRFNYRTIHDWVLLKFLGEEKLTIITDFLLAAKREEVDDYLDAFENELTKPPV
jgi:Fe-S-cluster containining protein